MTCYSVPLYPLPFYPVPFHPMPFYPVPYYPFLHPSQPSAKLAPKPKAPKCHVSTGVTLACPVQSKYCTVSTLASPVQCLYWRHYWCWRHPSRPSAALSALYKRCRTVCRCEQIMGWNSASTYTVALI